MTNVRKHATGAVAEVRIDGSASDGLTVEVRNALPTTQSSFVILDADGVVVASGPIRSADLPDHLDQLVG